MYVDIDRVSKFAYAQPEHKQTKMAAAAFLGNLIKAVPYKIHTVLTDNGIQFTNRASSKHVPKHIKEATVNTFTY